MSQVPILFLSDSPSLKTGLGRITRDLCSLTASLPEFRVGVLGRGGIGSCQIPVAQYTFPEVGGGWGETAIELAWKDFSRGKPGIILTIMDPSRMMWFSQPREESKQLYDFLLSSQFQRWGYWPVDATGVSDKLTYMSEMTIRGYYRNLAYTAWGAGVIERTIGRPVDWIPHGFNADTFIPRDKKASRMMMGVADDEILIGMNATNQSRKDWGCAFAAVAALKTKRKVKFWVHTDQLERHWSINALAADFGVSPIVTMCGSKTDTELSYHYSACDLTILPSAEGYGFPLVESMACGVPVIHGSYAGGAEIIPRESWLVEPVSYRLDTVNNVLRPVWEPNDWTAAMERALEERPSAEECRAAIEHLAWKNLWPSAWKRWFLEGLG